MAMLKQERRTYVRLYTANLPCQFRLVSLQGQPVETEKPGHGVIVNLSAGGMLFKSDLRIPIDPGSIFTFSFQLNYEAYLLPGRMLHLKNGQAAYIYGVKFVGLPDEVRQRLGQSLTLLKSKKVFDFAALK